MTKRRKAVLILLVTLILLGGGILYLFLTPAAWADYLVSYINENLLIPNEWFLSLVEIEGQLTSDVDLKSVYFRSRDGSIVVFCEDVMLNLNLSRILAGRWGIDELAFDNAIITFRSGEEESLDNFGFVGELIDNDFSVSTLRMSSATLNIIDQSKDKFQDVLYTIDLAGKIRSGDETLQFEPWDLHVTDLSSGEKIRLEAGVVSMGPTFIKGEELDIHRGEDRIVLSGRLDLFPRKQIEAEIFINDLPSSTFEAYWLDNFFETDRVDLDVIVSSDFSSGTATAMIRDSYSDQLLGKADVTGERRAGIYLLDRAKLELGSSHLQGRGTYSEKGLLKLNLEIGNLNLADIFVIGQETDIKGQMELTASLDHFVPEEMKVVLNLKNAEPGQREYVVAKGSIKYHDDRVEIEDSLRFDFDYGSITASGRLNLTNEQMAVTLTARQGNLSSLASVLEIGDISGRVRGTLEVSGYFHDPSLSGYLSFENIVTPDADLEEFAASFLVNSIISQPYGQFRAVSTNGHLRDFPLDDGEFDIFFRGDTLLVSKAKFQNDEYSFQASGQLIRKEEVVIDQMQLSFMDEIVTNGSQIVFHLQEDLVELEPAEFRLNNGRAKIAFVVEEGQLLDASLSIVNLDLIGLNDALEMDLPIVGDLFAEIALSTMDNIESAGVIEIKDGKLGSTSFEYFSFASDLKDNLFRIKELKIENAQQAGFMLSGSAMVRQAETGRLPFEIDPDGKVVFTGEFKNFQLKLLEDYLPSGVLIDGSMTGSLAISGTGKDPEMVYAFEIQSPSFDKISAKTILGSGRYTDHRLYFEDLVAYTEGGYYSGGGYLPVDLSLSRIPGNRWLEDDPLAMLFSAVTPNLEVLTPYLADIDSVTGDIEFELEITGTPSNPVRNGKFVIHDGTIYALMLELPVRKVEGSAILKENKFIVESLVAESHLSSASTWGDRLKKSIISGKKSKSNPNIRISGSMDLREFFWPNLAFLLTGQDVYIRTLLGEIEGVADLNLSITGKDTVIIAGDIIPSEAVLRLEFVEDPYVETVPEGQTITHYKLHFPMENGNILLQNSQVDAELEGTMSLYKLGNGPFRYSGEVDVRKGKFYYFSDVFNIESGHITFDPSEFNPLLDIVATTDVSDIHIDVMVSGKLDEPEIVLQASDEEGFYSQGDLLELLTIQRRLDGGGSIGDGFGDQSFYIFGKLLESELERNLIRSTPLDEFEIEGSESLMGDTEDDLSVKVGTKMSDNVYLSYKQSLSFSEPYQVGVEYKLTPNVSFVISYDEEGQVQVKYRLKRQF